jgi:hypothetical protein
VFGTTKESRIQMRKLWTGFREGRLKRHGSNMLKGCGTEYPIVTTLAAQPMKQAAHVNGQTVEIAPKRLQVAVVTVGRI